MAKKIIRGEATISRLEVVCESLQELQTHLDYDVDDLQIDPVSELQDLEQIDRYRGLVSHYRKCRKLLMGTLGEFATLQGKLEDLQDKVQEKMEQE